MMYYINLLICTYEIDVSGNVISHRYASKCELTNKLSTYYPLQPGSLDSATNLSLQLKPCATIGETPFPTPASSPGCFVLAFSTSRSP